MTSESYSARPSSWISVGIMISGLTRASASCGAASDVDVPMYSMRSVRSFSTATGSTLRPNGVDELLWGLMSFGRGVVGILVLDRRDRPQVCLDRPQLLVAQILVRRPGHG